MKAYFLISLVLLASLALGPASQPQQVPQTGDEVVIQKLEPGDGVRAHTVASVSHTTNVYLPMINNLFIPRVYYIGMVTDIGGVNDNSFNALAWKGVTDAIAQLDVVGQYLESSQPFNYAPNIQQLLDENQDLIITVGFLMGVDTATKAKVNPDREFAIVDYTYPDCWPGAVEGTDCGSSMALTNVRSLAFQTDQAAMLAGYLAAGMTSTGKVGTFGGMDIPTVTIFMDGFVAGVHYYNAQNSTSVEVLGWDSDTHTGLFTDNFDSFTDGQTFAGNLVAAGADIIMPVAGPVGYGPRITARPIRTA